MGIVLSGLVYLHVADQSVASTVLFIALGALGSALLVMVGLAALAQRRTRSYLFVVLALVTLLCKAVVGGITLAGAMSMTQHHLIEHALDFATAAFLLIAVYCARTERPAKTTAVIQHHDQNGD